MKKLIDLGKCKYCEHDLDLLEMTSIKTNVAVYSVSCLNVECPTYRKNGWHYKVSQALDEYERRSK